METGFTKHRRQIELVFLIVFVALVTSGSNAQIPEWWEKLQKAKPTVTTRAELENLFAPSQIIKNKNPGDRASGSWGEIVRYKTAYGRLEATYSTGKCSGTTPGYAYDLAEGVLVQLIFRPAESLRANRLNIDFDELRQERVDDIPEAFIYYDNRSGTRINLYKGRVREVEVDLSHEQLKLQCGNHR